MMKVIRLSQREATSLRGILALLAATAGVQLLLPSTLKIRCLFREWSGHPCPTCGATRCLQLMLQGDWANAFWMQPLVFCATLSAGALFLYSLVAIPLKLPLTRLKLEHPRGRIFAILLMTGLVAVNWVYLLAKSL